MPAGQYRLRRTQYHLAGPAVPTRPILQPRVTAAIGQLCEHLTATETTYTGTQLRLRYQIKNQP